MITTTLELLCFCPLKEANVVKEFQKTYSGLIYLFLQFPAEKYQVKNQYLINMGKLIICKKWPCLTLGLYFRVENRQTGIEYHSRR